MLTWMKSDDMVPLLIWENSDLDSMLFMSSSKAKKVLCTRRVDCGAKEGQIDGYSCEDNSTKQHAVHVLVQG